MRITHYVAVLTIVVSAFVACGNPQGMGGSSGLQGAAGSGIGAAAISAPSPLQFNGVRPPIARRVTMMDACDGPTFNLAIGPGTCGRNAGVSFTEFVAQLTAHQSAGAWHNAPSQTDAFLGDSLLAVNNGGEVHTFTRVANFGGGIVDFLNQLSGTPNEVPECAAETTFVPPGGSDTESLNEAGTLKFQCCIHPWMRTTVLVKSH